MYSFQREMGNSNGNKRSSNKWSTENFISRVYVIDFTLYNRINKQTVYVATWKKHFIAKIHFCSLGSLELNKKTHCYRKSFYSLLDLVLVNNTNDKITFKQPIKYKQLVSKRYKFQISVIPTIRVIRLVKYLDSYFVILTRN